MKSGIVKKLSNLSQSLCYLNLYEYAEKVTQLRKLATPIVDIIELNPDHRDPEGLFEGKSQWFDQLKLIGTNIVLLPFNGSDLTSADKKDIMSIWGRDSSLPYETFRENTGLLGYMEFNKSGRAAPIERFKSAFPGVWSKIKNTLSESGLSEDEIALILYNKDEGYPDFFDKNPFFLAHDLGHWSYDFSHHDAGDNSKKRLWFKHKVDLFIGSIIELYKNKNGLSFSDSGVRAWPEDWIPYFFDGLMSADKTDLYSDLFALATSKDGLKHYFKVPKDIIINDQKFSLSESDHANISLDFFEKIQEWIANKKDGPLHDLAGKVILYDMI